MSSLYDNQPIADLERQDMLERQVSVALEGGNGVEDDLEKAFDSELDRIVKFYQKKVSMCTDCRVRHPRAYRSGTESHVLRHDCQSAS